MQKSSKNRPTSVQTPSKRKPNRNRFAKVPKVEENKNSNILAFIRTFKPLNEISNTLNANSNQCKRRKTNFSHKILKNLRDRFDSLPSGYLKHRRMRKTNSQSKEQRNKYKSLLDLFREDAENTTPLQRKKRTLTNYSEFNYNIQKCKKIKSNVETKTEEIDSLLSEELSYQGDYISCTMEELCSIATLPKDRANISVNIPPLNHLACVRNNWQSANVGFSHYMDTYLLQNQMYYGESLYAPRPYYFNDCSFYPSCEFYMY